jgi:hypothetical protein
MPEGPKGNFPGSNSHGLGIPAGSKKKEAAWEFIKWALSKETIAMVVKNHGYPSVCRMSVIKSPQFKEVLTLNGQDVAALFLEVLQLGGKTGYMKYRTVPVYPQVGDKINKAIERIATTRPSLWQWVIPSVCVLLTGLIAWSSGTYVRMAADADTTARQASGSVTVKKMLVSVRPRVRAACSSRPSTPSNPACTVRTRSGSDPTKPASTAARQVNASSMPRRSSSPPIGPPLAMRTSR